MNFPKYATCSLNFLVDTGSHLKLANITKEIQVRYFKSYIITKLPPIPSGGTFWETSELIDVFVNKIPLTYNITASSK